MCCDVWLRVCEFPVFASYRYGDFVYICCVVVCVCIGSCFCAWFVPIHCFDPDVVVKLFVRFFFSCVCCV